MKIYIPSTQRPNDVKTLQFFNDLKNQVVLVVQEGEEKEYEHYGVEILGVSYPGIRFKRQWILDNARDPVIVMMDDDLTFYKRVSDKKFIKFEDERDIKNLFLEISKKIEIYAHIGITDKFMSQMTPRQYIENKRYNQVLCYNLNLFPSPKPEFRVEINEEHDMHLQLKLLGYPSCVLTEFTKVDKTYAKGGCSIWRTPEVELKAMQELEKLWPNVVKIVTHKGISNSGIRISWNKVKPNVSH